ncbi:MAG: hypothetical protein GY938_15240 [Ketobacter sp.]|nr:hypothetical protein [Ketobacter sp.]
MKIDPVNVLLYNEKSFLVMSPDGKMVMHNDNGKMTMSANGDFKADTGNGSSLEMLVSGTNTLTNSVSTLTMAGAINTLTNGISSLTMVGAVNTLTNGTSVIGQTAGMCTVNGCQITPTGNVITASGSNLDVLKSFVEAHTHTHGDPAGTTSTASVPVIP